jgi:predicted DNA-binding transcriptional regulator AlpA
VAKSEGSPNAPSRELRAFFARFFELTRREQLEAYGVISDYLAEDMPRERNREYTLRRRLEALEAIDQVVKRFKITDPEELTPDIVKEAAIPGWSTATIGRAFGGRWQWAKDAYYNRLPESVDQRLRHLAAVGRPQSRRDGIESVREWLATNPLGEGKTRYELWAEERNEKLPPDELPYPSAAFAYNNLQIGWAGVVALAKGEVTEDEARARYSIKERPRIFSAPDELIGTREVAAILGFPDQRHVSARVRRRPNFPPPVVVKSGASFWLRADIETHARDPHRPPQTVENALGEKYLDANEVAEVTRTHRTSVSKGLLGGPAPVVNTGGVKLWLRADVEDWFSRTPPMGRGGSRVKRLEAMKRGVDGG